MVYKLFWFLAIAIASHSFSVDEKIGCPAWMSKYVDFHSAKRLEARRIILQCPHHRYNGGLGDRLRGVMFALRVAVANDLILMINFDGNFNLTGMLEPANIDWTPLKGVGRNSVVVGEELRDGSPSLDEALVNMDADIHLCTRARPQVTYGFNITGDFQAPTNENYHCMWQALFKPAAPLQLAHDKTLATVFNSSSTPLVYVAVHLRMGGMQNEGEQKRTKSCNLLAQFAAQKCALELASAHIASTSTLPVLFITDSDVLRWAISNNLLARSVGPLTTAQHMSKTSGLDYMNEYVDLMLLAGATCLVISSSGFSNLALWWGGTKCITSVSGCIDNEKRSNDNLEC